MIQRARWASLTILGLGLGGAACHGKPGGATPPPANQTAAAADIPADLLTRAPAAQRSVVTRDGQAYLFLSQVRSYDEDPESVALAACWNEPGRDHPCPAVTAVPPAVAATYADRPKTLMVVGEDGPCVATVGEVQFVDTTGCEPSGMVAAPLTGCDGDLAPVGRIDRGFDADLRWQTAPVIDPVPLFADPAALPDPQHRALVTAWLADLAGEGAPHEGRTARVTLDAGAEALESFVAGYLVGDSADQCEWNVGTLAEVGLRRGDRFTPLEIPEQWDGALTWRGRVVGVVSGAPRDIVLHAIGPDARVAQAYDDTVWWDNEECTQGSWVGIEYPCGP